jgi:hypothetical protein
MDTNQLDSPRVEVNKDFFRLLIDYIFYENYLSHYL